MPLGDFVEPGTTPKPLRIGRTLRFGFGVGATAFFVRNFAQFDELVDTTTINVGYLAAAAGAWWYLSDAFIVGFGMKSGRWPQIIAIPVLLGLLAVGLITGGDDWVLNFVTANLTTES